MSNPLLQIISKLGPISPALEFDLNEKLSYGSFSKKQVILKEGQVCNHLYFVVKGLLRAYYERNGEDTSNWFMMENDFVISVNSFYGRTPSDESIEVLEDCELIYIHYDDLMDIYERHMEFNVIGRKLTEFYYCKSEERIHSLRGHQAAEKYEFLLVNYPDIAHRVSVNYLASYLGISPFTLSRIRAQIR
jgi:CRP-like cAMP-binding protein